MELEVIVDVPYEPPYMVIFRQETTDEYKGGIIDEVKQKHKEGISNLDEQELDEILEEINLDDDIQDSFETLDEAKAFFKELKLNGYEGKPVSFAAILYISIV